MKKMENIFVVDLLFGTGFGDFLAVFGYVHVDQSIIILNQRVFEINGLTALEPEISDE